MLAGLLLVALAHFFLGRLATVTRPLAVLAAGAALLVLALGAALPVLDDKYSVKALALELKARLLPADEGDNPPGVLPGPAGVSGAAHHGGGLEGRT